MANPNGPKAKAQTKAPKGPGQHDPGTVKAGKAAAEPKEGQTAMAALASVGALESGARGRDDALLYLQGLANRQFSMLGLETQGAINTQLLEDAPEFTVALGAMDYGRSWDHNPEKPDIIAFRKELLRACPREEGRYLDLIRIPAGGLLLVANANLEDEAEDYRRKLEKQGSSHIMHELFEDYFGNGWDSTNDDDCFGITMDRLTTESGDYISEGPNYFDKDHYTKNPVEELLSCGWVEMARGQEDDSFSGCLKAIQRAETALNALAENGLTPTRELGHQALYNALKDVAEDMKLTTPLAVTQSVGVAFMREWANGTSEMDYREGEWDEVPRWHDRVVVLAREEASRLLFGTVQSPIGVGVRPLGLSGGVTRWWGPTPLSPRNHSAAYHLDDVALTKMPDQDRIKGGWYCTPETIKAVVTAMPYLFTQKERAQYGCNVTRW